MFEITHANSSHSNESYSNYNDEDAEYYYYDEEEDDDEGEYEEENGGHDETDNEYYEEEEEEEGGERTCQKGCQCEDNSLLCNEFNIFRRFKTFSYAPRVKNIKILNQPRMHHLHMEDLKQFPNLKYLTISRTGLKWIHGNHSFSGLAIIYLDLSNNKLETMEWRRLGYYMDMYIDLRRNPLVCNCSVAYLDDAMDEFDDMVCIDPDGSVIARMESKQFYSCDIPMARMKVTATTTDHQPLTTDHQPLTTDHQPLTTTSGQTTPTTSNQPLTTTHNHNTPTNNNQPLNLNNIQTTPTTNSQITPITSHQPLTTPTTTTPTTSHKPFTTNNDTVHSTYVTFTAPYHTQQITALCQAGVKNHLGTKVTWLQPHMVGATTTEMMATTATTATLTLSHLNAMTSGQWVCRVENSFNYIDFPLHLTVQSAPIITKLVSFHLSPLLSIHYTVTAHPLPNITWLHHYDNDYSKQGGGAGSKVLDTPNPDIEIMEEPPRNDYEKSGFLRITMPLLKYNGNYTLVTTNHFGSASQSVRVDVVSHPDAENFSYSDSNHLLPTIPYLIRNNHDQKSNGVGVASISLLVAGWVFLVAMLVLVAMVLRRRLTRQHPTAQPFSPQHFNHTPNTSNFIHAAKNNNKAKISILYKNNKKQNNKNNNNNNKVWKRSSALEKMAALCLNKRFSNRPVPKEMMNLEHVVENPNYFKGDFEGEGCFGLYGLTTVPRISSERLERLQELGEGAFGLVYLGVMTTKCVDEGGIMYLPVAMKTVKDVEGGMRNLEREAVALSGLTHSNIVTFYGVCVDKPPPMIVLEYMPLGDLNKFIRLRGPDSEMIGETNAKYRYLQQGAHKQTFQQQQQQNHKYQHQQLNQLNNQQQLNHQQQLPNLLQSQQQNLPNLLQPQQQLSQQFLSFQQAIQQHYANDQLPNKLTANDLLNISVQISRGASYLASQRFVHRDLATRNCLVGRNMVVKIGDFGMSRDVYATDYYRVGSQMLMPIRWMPPESIMYKTFTLESDVWSVGVVLWEVFSCGQQPWYELSNIEVIQQLQKGCVMTSPSNCPAEVYQLMVRCWSKQPKERISVQQLCRQLEVIAEVGMAGGDIVGDGVVVVLVGDGGLDRGVDGVGMGVVGDGMLRKDSVAESTGNEGKLEWIDGKENQSDTIKLQQPLLPKQHILQQQLPLQQQPHLPQQQSWKQQGQQQQHGCTTKVTPLTQHNYLELMED